MLVLLPHCIQGDGERVDIRVVIVVDDGAVVHSRLDFQAHGDGSQRHESTGNKFMTHLHQQPNGNAVHRILDGCRISKRNRERQRHASVETLHLALLITYNDILHKEIGFLELAAPSEQFHLG